MGPSPLWFENELCLLLSYSCFAEGLNTFHSGNTQSLRVCAWLLYNYIISCYENCTQDSQFVYNLSVFSIYTFTNSNVLKKLSYLKLATRVPLVSNLIQTQPTKLNNVDSRTTLKCFNLQPYVLVLVWASVVALINAGERRSLPNQCLDITSVANIQIMPFLFLKLVSFDQYLLNLFTYDLTLIVNVYFFSCVVITTGFVKFCVQSTTF